MVAAWRCRVSRGERRPRRAVGVGRGRAGPRGAAGRPLIARPDRAGLIRAARPEANWASACWRRHHQPANGVEDHLELAVVRHSKAVSLRARSAFARSIWRRRTNISRMISMLTRIARSLRRMLDSIATPCSVNIGRRPALASAVSFCNHRLRSQTPELRRRELKHEVGREPPAIAPDRLVEQSDRHAVERCQVGVEHHTAAAESHDGALNPSGGKRPRQDRVDPGADVAPACPRRGAGLLFTARCGHADDRSFHRPLRHPREARRGRHGCGLPGARPAPGPLGGPEDPARRQDLGSRAPPALRAGGQGRLRPEPPEHRHHLRHRRSRRRPLHRHGTRPGRDARHAHRSQGPAAQKGARHRGAARRRPGEGARRRYHPPRPEAVQHHGDPGRRREDPRLRPRETGRTRRTCRRRSLHPNGRSVAADRRRHDPGHLRLHVAGAGRRQAGRCALGRLLVRIGVVRDALRAPARSRARPGPPPSRPSSLRIHRRLPDGGNPCRRKSSAR